MASQFERGDPSKRPADLARLLTNRSSPGEANARGDLPAAAVDAIALQVLAADTGTDAGVRLLTRFLERRGVVAQPGLVLAARTEVEGRELLTIALGFFGRGIAYVTHSRWERARESAAFLVGGAAFMVRNGDVAAMPLRPEHRQVVATWPFSMSVASDEPSMRRHCNAVCGPCFLWLATSAALSYSCAAGKFDSCPAALAARGQAELYCLQCVGCDWSP